MSVLSMTELDLYHKRVLIREDFNVPLNEQGEITSLARIEAALPTIKMALHKKARVILMSHLGRPKEGEFDVKFSLKPVAETLSQLLQRPVRLIAEPFKAFNVEPEEIVLLENTRFLIGEKQNQEQLARHLASLCDVFIMDAFAVAHRAQASTYGVAQYAPIAAAGPLLLAELEALEKALEQAEHPIVAIVAGSKVSTKLKLLTHLSEKADIVIVGGGIANTFLAASGYDVGRSLVEQELIPEADNLLTKYKEQVPIGYDQFQNEQGNDVNSDHPRQSNMETRLAKTLQSNMKTLQDKNLKFPLPVDVIVAKEFSSNAPAITKSLTEVESDDLILDIGPKTAEWYADILLKAKTIIWNGPVGVFEFEQFGQGTKKIAEAIAKSSAFSIAGGGDTIAAIEKYQVERQISYISTGGGAFLELLQGSRLPGVAILQQRK